MNPSAWFHESRRDRADDDGSTVAMVVAILFALLALVSFAIDQSITLPSQPVKPPSLQTPR